MSTFSELTDPIYKYIERKSATKFYPFIVAMLLSIISLALCYPKFQAYANDGAWDAIQLKSHDLTNSLKTFPPDTWMAKKVFRLVVPLIIRITHFGKEQIFVLQYIVNYFMIVFCYKLSRRIVEDAVAATFIVAGVMFVFFGRAGYNDFLFLWYDSFAFFALILAMYSRNVFLIFLLCSISAWTDERGFMALSMVYLFHQLSRDSAGRFDFSSFIKIKSQGAAVLLSVVAYLVIRMLLMKVYGMHTPSNGANVSVIEATLRYLPIGIWTFFEGFWILIVLAGLLAIKEKKFQFLILLIAVVIGVTFIAGCVTDITRSGTYFFPFVFVVLLYVVRKLNQLEIRQLISVCCLICLLFPPLLICSEWGTQEWSADTIFTKLNKRILYNMRHEKK